LNDLDLDRVPSVLLRDRVISTDRRGSQSGAVRSSAGAEIKAAKTIAVNIGLPSYLVEKRKNIKSR